MSTVNESISQYQTRFQQQKKSFIGAEHDWLMTLREQGLTEFAKTGFPHNKIEDWKYTDVGAISRRNFSAPACQHDRVSKLQIHPHTFSDMPCHLMVFVNGQFSPDLSEKQEMPVDACIESLTEVLHKQPELVQSHLGHYAQQAQSSVSQLNTAFMNDGAFIKIPANTELEYPIHLLYVTMDEQDYHISPRNVIVAEENAKATIIESYVSLDNAHYFTNTVTEVLCMPGSKLEHIKCQRESETSYHLANLFVEQQRDSQFNSHQINLGGRIARNDIHVELTDTGADCRLYGLYMGNERQHHDTHSTVHHAKPHCSSYEDYKGILGDRSRAVFNGKVIVHKNAQQTNAEQHNKNLLLSNRAEIDTKPQLEIFADDVKCVHGATVGQLDSNAIFYLQSRGIDAETAHDLLVYGFAKEVINTIPYEPIRAKLGHAILLKLPHGGRIKEYV